MTTELRIDPFFWQPPRHCNFNLILPDTTNRRLDYINKMAFFGRAWRSLDKFGQEAGKAISGTAVQTGGWIAKHPGQTAGIVSSIIAAPIAIAITPLALGVAGFTSAGIAAGGFLQLLTILMY